MTQEKNFRMAKEAGIGWGIGVDGMEGFIHRFADLVRADERNACIQVIKETQFSNWFQADCIEAIQARDQHGD